MRNISLIDLYFTNTEGYLKFQSDMETEGDNKDNKHEKPVGEFFSARKKKDRKIRNLVFTNPGSSVLLTCLAVYPCEQYQFWLFYYCRSCFLYKINNYCEHVIFISDIGYA